MTKESSRSRTDGTHFRQWLVEKLATSRYAIIRDRQDEDTARRIGVQLEVLREAQALALARIERERLPEIERRGQDHSLHKFGQKLILFPPPEVYEEWSAWKSRLRASSAALLRGVVHVVLRTQTQPIWLSTPRAFCWPFRGQWYGQGRNVRDKERPVISVRLTENSYRALVERATNTGTSISALGKWGVCLLISGKLPSVELVTTPYAMYRKTEDYCLKPEIID